MHNILNRSYLLSDAERRNKPLAIIGDRVITRAQAERGEPRKDDKNNDNNNDRTLRDDAADLEALQAKVELLEVENNDLRVIMAELAATARNALADLDKARAKQQQRQQQPQQRKQAQRAAATKRPTAAEVERVIRASSAALARMQAAHVSSRPMAEAWRWGGPMASCRTVPGPNGRLLLRGIL